MRVAVSLSSVADARSRIGAAHDIAFGSYFLGPGAMRDALTAASRRGAHVAVTLQADPYRDDSGEREHASADSATILRDAGAEVTLLPRERAPFHLKALVCDAVAYLDDRNWTLRGPETVLCDNDPGDVALVRAALDGSGGGVHGSLATRKDDALRAEAALIDDAGDAPVIVETERVGASKVTAALRRHALRGAATTLILAPARQPSPREHATIASLERDGVRVRAGGTNEKLALAGDRAWVGSTNATGAWGALAGQLDWGIVTGSVDVVDRVRATLAVDAATRPR